MAVKGQYFETKGELLLSLNARLRGPVYAKYLVDMANGSTTSHAFELITEYGKFSVTPASRAMVARWLGKLPKLTRPIVKEIRELIESLEPMQAVVTTSLPMGKLHVGVDLRFERPSTEAMMAYMAAVAFANGFGKNIQKCKHVPCGIWFFDKAGGRRIREYCCNEHRNAAGQARYRAKHKSEGGK